MISSYFCLTSLSINTINDHRYHAPYDALFMTQLVVTTSTILKASSTNPSSANTIKDKDYK